MAIRIAINGFGRNGRAFLREAKRRGVDFNFAAINDVVNPSLLAANLRFDSVHGAYPKSQVKITEDREKRPVLAFGDDHIRLLGEKDNDALPWKELGVDVVFDTTGAWKTREKTEAHLRAGAKKVIVFPPPPFAVDATVVKGVNDSTLTGKEKVISAGSCTTNAVAPLAKLLDDAFGIEMLFITSVHAFTSDQRLLDFPHSDVRRSRAAGLSIIPTTTGAARAVELVLPSFKGRLFASAHRVPIPDGSICDLQFSTKQPVDADPAKAVAKINEVIAAAAAGPYQGVIEYSTDPLVSVDVMGNPHSAIFDAELTQAIDNTFFKVSAWFDNEIGYANRVIDLILKLDSLGPKVWS
jgi:glyceraldehyde 3-phosphate dehydrogenase